MTTNVYDSAPGMMATDSRISVMFGGQYMLYLDDTGFCKIEEFNGTGFMFAGYLNVIQQWKNWLRTNPTSVAGQPPHQGLAVTMVQKSDRSNYFSYGDNIQNSGAVFAGTGAIWAFSCWKVNKDPKRSVETAKGIDPCTGGETKFLDCVSGEHNLYHGADVTVAEVNSCIQKRGLVMKMNEHGGSGKVPFAEKGFAGAQASNDEDSRIRAEAAEKIASGELNPAAPCDSMLADWPQEQKAKFTDALRKAFGWK